MNGRCLGLDPSIAAFGYAVLECVPSFGLTCIEAGTWKTRVDGDEKKTVDRARRLHDLGLSFVALLDTHDPVEEVFVESLALGMKTSRLTAQVLGRVRGLVEGVCLMRGLKLTELDAATVKNAVTGRKSASKEEVALAVRRFYPAHSTLNLDDNATDALAVAHVGATRHGVSTSSGVVSYRTAQDEPDELDF